MSGTQGHDVQAPERWTLTLTPLPGWPTPGIQRLRRALKALRRSYGLRCERLEPGGPHDGK